MKMKTDMMKRAMQSGNLVEVYTDREETDRFCVGWVLAMDEEYYAMRCTDKYGTYDGYIVRKLDMVYMVCEDTQYIRRIEKLGAQKDCGFEPDTGMDLRIQMLDYAQEKGCVVQVELMDSGSYDAEGFVEVTDEGVCISMLDDNGCFDGRAAFSWEDVTEICCDDIDNRRLRRLHELQTKTE